MFNIKEFLKSNGRTAKASRQIAYSFILQGLSIVIGLLYVPLLLNYLTQEKYGIWLTLTSILGWFSFFDIGLGNGLRNKLGEAFAKDDLELGRKYVSTTYALLIIIFSIVLFIFHILNFFLNWNSILNTETISNHELYILASIVFTFFIVRFVVQLISVVYFADQKSAMSNLVNTSGSLISFILVLILTYSSIKGNLVLLGSIISAIPVIVFVVISIISFGGKYKQIKPSVKFVDFKLSNKLMNLGFKFFFMQISAIIIFSTSSFFIAQYYGPQEVVAYNIVFKYFQIPVMVFTIILSPVWSAVTDANSKSDYIWLRKTIKRLNIFSAIFSIVVIFMIIISPMIFKLWLGNKVLIPINLTITMALYTIIQLWKAPFSNYINGFGKIKLSMSFTILEITVYLLIVFIISPLFSNPVGIIFAIICATSINGIIQPLQTFKILNKSAKGIWNQ